MTNRLPTRPASRDKVYDVLDGERDYQVENYPSPSEPDLARFSTLLIEYTDKLAVDVTVDPAGSSPDGGPLKRLREIATIAVHAMEVHGAQPRENHVPASAGVTGTAHIVAKPDATLPTHGPTGPTHAQSAQPMQATPPADAAHVHAPTPHTPEPVAEHTTQHGSISRPGEGPGDPHTREFHKT